MSLVHSFVFVAISFISLAEGVFASGDESTLTLTSHPFVPSQIDQRQVPNQRLVDQRLIAHLNAPPFIPRIPLNIRLMQHVLAAPFYPQRLRISQGVVDAVLLSWIHQFIHPDPEPEEEDPWLSVGVDEETWKEACYEVANILHDLR